MNNCYVCDRELDLSIDKHCYKNIDNEIRYRCLWHGVPGIRYTSFGSYAHDLTEARRRAEMYLVGSSAPYAAPEVKQQEQEILKEVERIENLGK